MKPRTYTHHARRKINRARAAEITASLRETTLRAGEFDPGELQTLAVKSRRGGLTMQQARIVADLTSRKLPVVVCRFRHPPPI